MAIKLTDIVYQNRWWKGDGWEANDQDLRKVNIYLKRKNIEVKRGGLTLLRGVRRSGKTVYVKKLVQHLIEDGVDPKNILYLSCDRHTRFEIRNFIRELMVRRGECFVFLDEITYMDRWDLFLKETMERGGITLVATGSNPIRIKNGGDRLPGRGIEGNEYYIGPLSFREYVEALIDVEPVIEHDILRTAIHNVKGLDVHFSSYSPKADDLIAFHDDLERLFYNYLLTGGFPNAITDHIKNGNMDSSTYETLIRVILGVFAKEGRNEEFARVILEKLLDLRSSGTGLISISRDTGIHHNTVRDYLELLEEARVIFVLQSWDIERGRLAPKKKRKMVFQSPLIATALHVFLKGGGWEEAQNFVDRRMESLVEDTVATHLIWTEEIPTMREKHSFAGFYYDRRECDFVMRKKEDFFGFETKYGKLKRANYPFKTLYLTKDIIDTDALPTSLFLFGLKKGKGGI